VLANTTLYNVSAYFLGQFIILVHGKFSLRTIDVFAFINHS
jgi:hypothetical protein